jgi:hypothetical protein
MEISASAEPIRLHQSLRNSAYLATFWQRSNFSLYSQSLALNSCYANRQSVLDNPIVYRQENS